MQGNYSRNSLDIDVETYIYVWKGKVPIADGIM